MRITLVTGQTCARAVKQALALTNNGHEIHLITQGLPTRWDFFKTVTACQNEGQVYEAIKLHKDTDIFHVHNEPSMYVGMIKSELPHKKVVIDVHDSYIVRETGPVTDEIQNFTIADGLVFVSDIAQKMVREAYALQQPTTVLESYVNHSYYASPCSQWLGGIAMEGRVTLPKENINMLHAHDYCDYIDLFTETKRKGLEVFMYSTRDDKEYINTYKDIVNLLEGVPLKLLIRLMGRHQWGFVGNSKRTAVYNNTCTNKMFEYIAAGIPVIALNAKWTEDFIVANGVGIAVKSVDEIVQRYEESPKYLDKVLRTRYQFTMEKHIHRVEKLYKEVLC